MEYSDNPRKVYGKVEIVYSDKEISSNMGITVSGNSKISHPREVFEGYVSPTVRACTMDGRYLHRRLVVGRLMWNRRSVRG